MVTFSVAHWDTLDESLARGVHWLKFWKQRAIKKIESNIFIAYKFCKKCTCKIGDFKTVKHVYM